MVCRCFQSPYIVGIIIRSLFPDFYDTDLINLMVLAFYISSVNGIYLLSVSQKRKNIEYGKKSERKYLRIIICNIIGNENIAK